MQQNLDVMRDADITPFAISPDTVDVLALFAAKFGITYPLLSAADATVIRAFGILNDSIAEEHEHYGLPRPGTYLIGEDGRVFAKSFYEGHNVRDAINDVLHDDFGVVGAQAGPVGAVNLPNARVTASFASATIRRAQSLTLTVRVDVAAGKRLGAPPGAGGRGALDVQVEGSDAVSLVDVSYPEADGAYCGSVVVKATCLGVNEDRDEDVDLTVRVRYQARDDHTIHPPEEATIPLSLRFVPHDWARV